MLAGVSLRVMPGESLVIIGGSGTGKSVTLKCILGILAPDAGAILIDGVPVERVDRRAFLRHFGMLFQGGALFDSLPVWQNVAFRLRQARKPMPRREARALAHRQARAASGSGRRWPTSTRPSCRAACRSASGSRGRSPPTPKVIFFDEPTAGLDPIMAGVINDLIRELVAEMGATAITITHDMTTVRTVADHVAMLHGGVVRWSGPIEAMEASGDPYLEQFIHGRADGPIAAIR